MTTPADEAARESRVVALCSVAVAAATIAAYSGTLRAPFIYDDPVWVMGGSGAHGPSGAASGRPLLALSFALNRAVGGINPLGYHLVNIAIHVAAALVLLGIVRRTLCLLPGSFPRLADRTAPAVGAAFLWALHPANTEAVTYVSQRSESLAGLLCFVALYGFIRGSGERARVGWLAVSAAACALGMAVKETMATVPLLILLYDRTFITGGFLRSIGKRGRYYAALALGWAVLGALMSTAGPRGVGLGLGYSSLSYSLVEAWVIPHYLLLCAWPFPLVFDRGTDLVASAREAAPWACVTAAALGIAVLGVLRRSPAGFAWAAFFLAIAPSSSLVPVAFQPMADHRLYVPLAALASLASASAWFLLGRRSAPFLLVAAVSLGVAAFLRNGDYRDPVVLWAGTVRRAPDNERARLALAESLSAAGRDAESAGQYREALRLAPGDADARLGLVAALVRAGRLDEAAAELRAVPPSLLRGAELHVLLARALDKAGRAAEAAAEFRRAAEINPGVSL